MKYAEVVEMMKSGWVLHRNATIDGRWWLSHKDGGGYPTVYPQTGYKVAKLKDVRAVGPPFPVQDYIWSPRREVGSKEEKA